MSETPPLLKINHVSKTYHLERSLNDVLARKPQARLAALRDVSLTVRPNEILAVVGESGCGKSTLGRCIVGLDRADSGTFDWQGGAFDTDRRLRARQIQMVFQDPYASLNPRMTLGAMLDEVLRVHSMVAGAKARRDRIDELLVMVGLTPGLKDRLPHSISGGQRQRISIARALAMEPRLLIADEPVSALDASVQAQIINLFEDLRATLGIAILFIAHDLNVVRHISDRIAVMYLGEVVEIAETEALFAMPQHPYTRGLLASIPMPDPNIRAQAPGIEGEVPDPLAPPAGCGFSTRCPYVLPACRAEHPELKQGAKDHFVRCLNPAASTEFDFTPRE